jgi:hypothetical protein
MKTMQVFDNHHILHEAINIKQYKSNMHVKLNCLLTTKGRPPLSNFRTSFGNLRMSSSRFFFFHFFFNSFIYKKLHINMVNQR